MEDFQKRVITEKSDLDEKRIALETFILGSVYPTLPEAEQSRLAEQASYMAAYSAVLSRRIIAFKS